MILATVVERFFGVPDGEVYPRWFEAGEPVSGDLARVAIEEKNAVEGAAAAPVVNAPETTGADDVNPTAAPDQTATAAVNIPPDWKLLPWPKMRALAQGVAGRTITGKDDANAVITKALAAQGAPQP